MLWPLGVVMRGGNVAGVLVAPRAGRPSVARAIAAIALGVCAVVAPALWPSRAWPSVRTVLAFGTMAGFYRLVEILRHPEIPLAERVAAATYPVIGPRRVARVAPTLRADAFVVGGAYTAFAVGLYVMAWSFPPAAPYSGASSAMRTLVGGASAYFLVDGTARLTEGLASLVGFDLGPLHDAPILARSLSEFWSRRWNRSVHRWLDENAFRPTMRIVLRRAGGVQRGPRAVRLAMTAGVLAAFVASAMLHFVPVCVALDPAWAAVMGFFFLLQGALVALEERIGVARWPSPLARAWTLGVMYATAPLFVEPLLRSMGH